MKNLSGTSLLVSTVLATAGFTTLAMGQVANDECSGAIALTAGTAVAFDTTNATSSADAAPTDAQCTGTFLEWGTSNKDVWFSYTATGAGTIDLSTCLAGGYDTSMVVYSGSCGALTQVGCNGDAPADAACQNFFSKITGLAVTSGTTYYVRVGGYTDPATGVAFGAASMLLTFTPAGAGCPATGGCGVVHATPGCEDAACCTAVCAANPLCCEIGWDETCVQGAVAACGIFVHQCITPNAAVANDCAPAATVVTGDTSRVVNNAGCNTDGPNHPAATCASGNDTFLNDVWYRFQSPANGSLRVYTCNNSTFDTKLAVYNMGTDAAAYDYDTLNTTLVGCNDDGSTECQTNATFASDLTVNVVQNNWYLVRVATYDVPGTCTVFIDMPEPCALPAQTGVEAEACGSATNNGCNAAGETETIIVGSRTKGTFATFTDPVSGANTRDTDFYRLDVAADTQVTVNIYSRSFVTGLVLGGNITTAACAGVNVLGTASGNCPSTGSVCLNPGTYYIFVAPSSFTGLPCGSGVANDYVVEVLGAPASCPDVLDQVCADPSVNSYVSSTAAVGGGLVACAVNAAFPACTNAGTTVNTYARPMPAGAIGGSITCLNFGAFSVRRNVNAGNTACANFASDLPLPATIGVYEDVDGGAPRNKIVTTGDGNDLRLIETREVLIPGGAYLANLDFDPPLCLDGVAGNIVVVMDCPDLYTAGLTPSIPDAAGYGLRPSGGAVTGQNSGTYLRLSCADAAGAYVLAETVGATFTAQWVVSFNGDFSGCGTPCPTDLNGDGVTGSADLSILLNGWGGTSPDLNGDGAVGSADLSVLLNGWGACP